MEFVDKDALYLRVPERPVTFCGFQRERASRGVQLFHFSCGEFFEKSFCFFLSSLCLPSNLRFPNSEV